MTAQHRPAIHRTGTGPPLVLLHALGSSSHTWEPVLPHLVDRFAVIAVDLPGFGNSPALPTPQPATPAALAAAVDTALLEAGIHRPHVVGNSLGGWVALELAQIRPVATLTLLSPAGMWVGDAPRYCRLSLRGTRWLTQHVPRLLNRLVDYRLGRILALGQTHGRPTRVSPEQARAAIRAMGTCSGFAAALRATTHLRYQRSRAGGPRFPQTTVVFGTRDLLLLRRTWRRVDELPTDTVVRELSGCGHLPMYDDPVAVADLIAESTATRALITLHAADHG